MSPRPQPQASFFRLRLKILQSPEGELPGDSKQDHLGLVRHRASLLEMVVKRNVPSTRVHGTPWMERRAHLLAM